MTRLVMKFGGTSCADQTRLDACAKLVAGHVRLGHAIAVVVSAPAGMTDSLEKDVHNADPDGKWADEGDAVLASGEQVNAALMAMALRRAGLCARSFTGWQAGFLTDGHHGAAKIGDIDGQAIGNVIDDGTIAVLAGYQGIGPNGRITTLGRGGTDLSAVALAAALNAEVCEIYTDVDGVFSADPHMVQNASLIQRLSYEEMLEMASQGSKVMQSRSVELAMAKKVRLRVLSSFENKPTKDSGTMISHEAGLERAIVRAVSYSRDEARIMVQAMPSGSKALKDVFAILREAGVQVDLIVHAPAEEKGKSMLVFALRRADANKAFTRLSEAKENLGLQEVSLDRDMAKVSIIGIGLRSQTGIALTVFETLNACQIEIGAVATSETRISVLLAASALEKAVQALHSAFGLDQGKS